MDYTLITLLRPIRNLSYNHVVGVSTTMSQWGVSSRHSLSETFAGEASSAKIVSTRGGNTHGFDDAASYSSSATTAAAAVAVVAYTETSPEPSAANDSHLRFMHTLVNSPGIKDIVCSLISDFVCGELFNSVVICLFSLLEFNSPICEYTHIVYIL